MADKCIMHLDMDAFYASVEQADFPELKGKPVIVGGSGGRGVVSACSYEARVFGVRSAMSSFEAKRRCPHAIFQPVRMQRYVEISRNIMSILDNYSPVVEKASVDEAYLDISGMGHLFSSPEEMAMVLKKDIKQATTLNCSIGIAPLKFLAKIASDENKPNGLFILREKDVPAFLAALPIRKIPGVGKRSLEQLEKLCVRCGADVLRYPQSFWEERGKAGMLLFQRASGIDPRVVTPYTAPKSESAENTFTTDTKDREELKKWLFAQSERVGRSLRKSELQGKTITLKVKYADFKQITRSRTLRAPTAGTDTIFQTACSMLDELKLADKVRLIGVGVSNFNNTTHQLSLFDDGKDKKIDKLEKAVDAIRDKFGGEAVVRGRLLGFKSRKH